MIFEYSINQIYLCYTTCESTIQSSKKTKKIWDPNLQSKMFRIPKNSKNTAFIQQNLFEKVFLAQLIPYFQI